MNAVMVAAVRKEFKQLVDRSEREMTYGDVQFWMGFFCGRGVDVEDVRVAIAEMHEAGDLPNLFDMIDDESARLLERKAG